MKILSVCAVLGCWLLGCGLSVAGDWPMAGHDAHRSHVTDEKLVFPLKPAWVYTAAQPPRPAWPEPVKSLNRMDFDYAFVPVVAGGLVVFGSSADDTVRALDLDSGALRWQFATGGPIRFAPAFAQAATVGKPQVAGGRVYIGSDDGVVYCLDAATGKPVWTFRGGLDDTRLIGNERMIARWPVRTGVLVEGGVLYVVFGLWPAEEIFVYALNPDTGKVIWCNDTSGFMYMSSGHTGEWTLSGVCPQGALLAEGDVLVVPTGRCIPAAYNRNTGAFLYHDVGDHKGQGGTWVAIDGNKLYVLFKNFFSGIGVSVCDLATGKGRVRSIVPQLSTFRGKGWRAHQMYSVFETGKIGVVVTDGKVIARKAYGLALAANALLVGTEGRVSAEDPKSGAELWNAPVRGQARELVVADGRLIVSTDKGEISCFAAAGNKAVISGQSSVISRQLREGRSRRLTKAHW